MVDTTVSLHAEELDDSGVGADADLVTIVISLLAGRDIMWIHEYHVGGDFTLVLMVLPAGNDLEHQEALGEDGGEPPAGELRTSLIPFNYASPGLQGCVDDDHRVPAVDAGTVGGRPHLATQALDHLGLEDGD